MIFVGNMTGIYIRTCVFVCFFSLERTGTRMELRGKKIKKLTSTRFKRMTRRNGSFYQRKIDFSCKQETYFLFFAPRVHEFLVCDEMRSASGTTSLPIKLNKILS